MLTLILLHFNILFKWCLKITDLDLFYYTILKKKKNKHKILLIWYY